jgi:streptogramin lyase
MARYSGGGCGFLRVRRVVGRAMGMLLTCGGVGLLACSGAVAAPLGMFKEFQVPHALGGTSAIAAGAGGDMWFIAQSSGKYRIGRIAPSGAITEFLVPTHGRYAPLPAAIVAGPGGDMWFTESTYGAVGRITRSGAITVFPIASGAGSSPGQIAAGPDGNMWFTESGANKIGRITPAGAITQFPVPTVSSAVSGIAGDTAGNMWFTEYSANKIGRITPSGAITEFPVPTAASGLNPIVAGPDGNTWFPEQNGHKIGRITPSGAITEFPVATAPFQIAAGPDGNLWFTEQDGHKIGRITPSGAITAFSIPAANLLAIAAGPGGNMWITFGNHVGLIGDGPPGAQITKATISSGHRQATFRFKAVDFGTGFQCAFLKLGAHHKQPTALFSSCKSPTTYKHLKAGRYTFEVRALDAARHGTSAGNSFKIG